MKYIYALDVAAAEGFEWDIYDPDREDELYECLELIGYDREDELYECLELIGYDWDGENWTYSGDDDA